MANTEPHRIPGLDGIRALAVALVVAYHMNLVGAGWIGVQLFFVLSGFLITRLLLQLRCQPTLGAYLRTFYGRRVLRIFPLYYAFLLGLLVVAAAIPALAADVSRGQWLTAFSFTYNWHGMTQHHHANHALDHFWSLAIEEQFYLVWPFLVYFLRESLLRRVLIALVLGGPVLRFALFAAWPAGGTGTGALPYAIAVSTLSHLDAFAAGALLCFAGGPAWSRPPLRLALVAGTLLAYALGAWSSGAGLAPARPFGAPLSLGFPNTLPGNLQFVWGYSAVNALSALLIGLVAYGRFGARLFAQPKVAYLGAISYGVYVFHYPLAHLMSPLVYEIRNLTGAGFHACILLWAPLYLTVLLAVSSLSYERFERRVLALKERWFPASRPAPAA